MLLFADENFYRPVVLILRATGHDVLTAQEVGLAGSPDPLILRMPTLLGGTKTTVVTMNDCTGLVWITLEFSPQLMTQILPDWPANRTCLVWDVRGSMVRESESSSAHRDRSVRRRQSAYNRVDSCLITGSLRPPAVSVALQRASPLTAAVAVDLPRGGPSLVKC